MNTRNINPYIGLPEKAFWKPAVATLNPYNIVDLWKPKFSISPDQNIVTFGSCFAQHIASSLQKEGFGWLTTEPPPYGLTGNNARLFNYNVFSSRTGNIYTSSLLMQWTKWALNISEVPDEIWEEGRRYYDPFRPAIEPNGYESKEEVNNSRKHSVRCFKEAIVSSDFFIFTMGLTESWVHCEYGYEYPMCPGTVAGRFFAEKHQFKNLNFSEVINSLRDTMFLMREVNNNLKFILTVSPIPLTATMSESHVLVATTQSKSVLRAVAGQLSVDLSFVDYFPSYEMINNPVFQGRFFEKNKRNITDDGISFVMSHFFRSLSNKPEEQQADSRSISNRSDNICEEELLEAFRKK